MKTIWAVSFRTSESDFRPVTEVFGSFADAKEEFIELLNKYYDRWWNDDLQMDDDLYDDIKEQIPNVLKGEAIGIEDPDEYDDDCISVDSEEIRYCYTAYDDAADCDVECWFRTNLLSWDEGKDLYLYSYYPATYGDTYLFDLKRLCISD